MTTIQMPQLGETIVEGTILKWLKREGEEIERDEPLFEISTDKVDTEVPSPVSGTVSKILVEEGQTVPVGTDLAEVSEDGQAAGGAAAAPAAPAEQPAASAESEQAVAEGSAAEMPAAEPATPQGVAASAPSEPAPPATPAAAAPATAEVPPAAAAPAPTPAAAPAPAAPAPAAAPGAATPAVAPAAGEEVVPVDHIRKAIGQHMAASVQTSARAWTMVEVNVDHLVKLRERAKDAFKEKYGVSLTYLPFVIRATCDALLTHPEVNSQLRGEEIVLHRFVNMGIAVSYDKGLIVPVIKGADAMNTVGLARSIADLAARARAHQLKPDEVQGSTFTITNPGPYGSVVSVPIINQPNTGILSLDAITKRAIVIEDTIAIRSMVNISMSWDHRTIDGEIATRFLARVKQNLETWDFAEDVAV